MFNRIMKTMARWYFRNVYQPVALDPQQPFDHPAQHHLDSVPWISTWETVCQSTALQMIAAHYGIERPRRHFDFLMGFTYGASYRGDFGFITVGTDPETGLLTAAPYLGLARRYYFTDDATLYVRALRSYLARGFPIRVPLDMGALYGQAEPLPHNEVLRSGCRRLAAPGGRGRTRRWPDLPGTSMSQGDHRAGTYHQDCNPVRKPQGIRCPGTVVGDLAA